jgi:ABC-2 type transport system permease protein
VTALVRSELTKILSTRLWWGLLIGAAVYTALQAGITAGFAGLGGDMDAGIAAVSDPETVRMIYAGSAFTGAYILALVVGIMGMTAEHRYQTATPTFLATPRRTHVVVAKALANIGIGVVYGLTCVVTAFVVGGTVIAIRGESLGLGAPGLWRAVALAVLAVGLWTLLGLGIGTMIRNQVAAILVGVAVTFLVEPLLSVALAAADLDGIGKYLPSLASSAITSPGSAFGELLPWWGGGLVLLGYALLFAGIGMALTVRRDVS